MSDNRPKTASRPRTARPPTSAGQAQQWPDDRFDEEEEEEDYDVGMFSFMRPATGDAAQSDTPSTSAPHTSHSPSSPYSHPYSPFQFGFAAYGSVPPSTAAPSEGARPTTSYGGPFGFAPPGSASPLSPAAAYAHQVQSGESASPTAPLSPEPQPGPRKRGSWQSPDSPNHVVGNPYEERLRHESSRRTSDGSSRDKVDALGSSWADQPVSFAVDETGQAIMLDEMGHPLRTATTREQKMLAATDLGPEIPYSERLDDESTVEDDSPYPEVRASVSNYDDTEVPALTFRSWTIGLLFCIIVSAANTFFALRYPAPVVSPVVTQVLSYPFGKFLARVLPYRAWTLPRWTRRLGMPEKFSFNPGPFNIKEHTVLVIMANISTSSAYAINYSLAAEKGYGQHQPAGFDILLILTTQTIGFGAAGLCRRFLVWPAAMIWPQNLVFCTLLNTFHAEIDDEEDGPSRFRFFLFIIGGAFAWYWLPGFLFTALSAFSWVCWIAPNNVVVNQLFGVSSGLGMGIFTFDWSQISYIGSPLVIPWWAEVNIFVAFIVAFWIIAPIMYYTNVWNTAFLPISTSAVFDRFGQQYDTSLIVDSVNMQLNATAYHEYSPLYLPITYATTYGVAFALAIAAIVHTVLYNGKDIWRRTRRSHSEDEDVHMRLMKAYPEVPDWWYLLFLAIAFGLSIVTVACWDTFTPVWSVVIAISLGLVYLIPGGFIFALTTNTLNINLVVQLIAGYVMPGKPLANMLFKVYSVQTLNVGLYFSQDLKLGHYMKIPPRATFLVQVVATITTAFVQVGVKRWLNSTVPDLCDSNQSARLVCPLAATYYSASIIWGLIGPARQFGIGHYYNSLLYWMIGGAVLPTCTWLLSRRYRNSWVPYINIPVGLAGLTLIPPATGINWSSWFLVGFVFQFLMRRRHFDWWSKYNFVLSAGLDAGTVLAALVIFFALQLPKGGSIALHWWGNDVYTRTLDWAQTSFKSPPAEGFGRTSW